MPVNIPCNASEAYLPSRKRKITSARLQASIKRGIRRYGQRPPPRSRPELPSPDTPISTVWCILPMSINNRGVSSIRRFEWTLLLTLLTLVTATGSATVPASRRERAAAAYQRAEQMHATLEARSVSTRTKNEYQKVIDAYFDVYRQSPAYGKTPVALTAMAELYREMGSAFS